MGIKGLTTFIDGNPHLLVQHEFRDCSVVVDGNNFYHYLFYACHVNCSLGGDYDVYRKNIVSTFKAMQKCGIRPYVVFDGGYTVDDRKLRTSLMRASTRIELVSVMSRFGRGQVLPILAYDTMIQTLNELGVYHVTCQFEADTEIAVLANKLNCPVISNDSDFYIFDLTAGFLPLDYIDFRPLSRNEEEDTSCNDSSSSWFLHSKIYSVDDFIDSFPGLSRQTLPVFACLLGNDYIKAKDFDAFYKQLQVPKVVSKKFKLPPRLSKIISIIHWFQIHNKNWSKLLTELLDALQIAGEGRRRRIFFASVNSYINIDSFEGCDLYSYFKSNEKVDSFVPKASLGFTGFNGNAFPDWFLQSVCKGEITPSILNVAVLHRLIFLSQVENLSEVTSYDCSQGVRKVLYGIIFKSDPVRIDTRPYCHIQDFDEQSLLERFSQFLEQSSTSNADGGDNVQHEASNDSGDEEEDEEEEEDEKEGDETNNSSVEKNVSSMLSKGHEAKLARRQNHLEEYRRVKRHLERNYIEAGGVPSVNGVSLLTLSDLDHTPVETRLKILLAALQVDVTYLAHFSEEMCLYFACLITWLRNSAPKISERHLDCVLLCIIYLKIHERISGGVSTKRKAKLNKSKGSSIDEDNKVSSTSLIDALEAVPGNVLENMHKNLSKYHKNVPSFDHKNRIDTSVIHAFAQLQACMLDASNLNKLLRFPLFNLRPAALHNGTFLYNLFNDLVTRPKPDSFVGSHLLCDSELSSFVTSVKSIIKSSLPENTFADGPQQLSRKTRKRKSKGGSVKPKMNEERAQSSESEEDEEINVVSGFDINNKFASLLSLGD